MRSGVCADIRDGREQTLPARSRIQMSTTNYRQIVHIRLATHGRSIQSASRSAETASHTRNLHDAFWERKKVFPSIPSGFLKPLGNVPQDLSDMFLICSKR